MGSSDRARRATLSFFTRIPGPFASLMTEQPQLTSAFRAAFTAEADPSGTMRFDRFMELALYHPQLGYYRATARASALARDRIFSRRPRAVQFLANSLSRRVSNLLGSRVHPLITRSSRSAPKPATAYSNSVSHPFASARTCRLGEPLGYPAAASCFRTNYSTRNPSEIRSSVRLVGGISRAIARDVFEPRRGRTGTAPSELPRSGLTDTSSMHRWPPQPWPNASRASLGAGYSWPCDYGKTLAASSLRRVRTERPAPIFAINSPTTCSPGPVNRTSPATYVGIG